MNCIEQLHFEAIGIPTADGTWVYNEDANESAKKSAEITEQTACEFAEWVMDIKSSIVYSDETCTRLYKELFQEFLKSKQPNDGIQTS